MKSIKVNKETFKVDEKTGEIVSVKKQTAKIDCSNWSMRKFNQFINKILDKTRRSKPNDKKARHKTK